MMPAWMSALAALLLFLSASLWMVAAKKRRQINLTWQHIYLTIWALAGCLTGLCLFSTLDMQVHAPVFILGLFSLTGLGVIAGHFLAVNQRINYESWGKHILPFLDPHSSKAQRKIHHRYE